MKFYFDGELICTSNAMIYTHAVVFPSNKAEAINKWVMHSRHVSQEAAERALTRTRRGMSLYDPEKARALRVVALEVKA